MAFDDVVADVLFIDKTPIFLMTIIFLCGFLNADAIVLLYAVVTRNIGNERLNIELYGPKVRSIRTCSAWIEGVVLLFFFLYFCFLNFHKKNS